MTENANLKEEVYDLKQQLTNLKKLVYGQKGEKTEVVLASGEQLDIFKRTKNKPDIYIASIKHQKIFVIFTMPAKGLKISRNQRKSEELQGLKASPKPRVESSILSAPAKKQRIIIDYSLFLCLKSLKYVILTLTKGNLDRDQTYFSPLQCLVFVNTFSVCNDSVCYSIKKASICYYEYQLLRA